MAPAVVVVVVVMGTIFAVVEVVGIMEGVVGIMEEYAGGGK